MMPLVSICIPAFNAAKYIEDTIVAIQKQSYINIEIVVCNDGSTDDTANVLSKFKTYKNIVVVHTANRGPGAASNEAFKNSKGDFIKFVDSDDLLNPTHIEVQVQMLLSNANCIAAGQLQRFYKNDIRTALHEPLETWQALKPMDWLLIGNGQGLGMMQCGMFLIPRNVLVKAGGWDDSLSLINDFEFFPRLLLAADNILFTEKAILLYRSGAVGTLSGNTSPAKLISAFKALELTTNLLLKYENSERVKRILSMYWNLWKYDFYLNNMKLYKGAINFTILLGNHPDLYFNKSRGKISRLLGWKNHKRIFYIIDKYKSFFNLK